MTRTFSFHDKDICEIALDGGTMMRIERVGFSVARIYFVDDSLLEVPVPSGFVIRDITNKVAVKPFPTFQAYFLAWTDTYSIALNGELIIELAIQRQWSLRGPPERTMAAMDR